VRRALLLLALLGAGCHRRPTAQPAGPRLQVRVARAASAVENESAVAVPLERALAPLPGLQHLESVSTDAAVELTAQLQPQADPFEASQRANALVTAALNTLPADAEPPEIRRRPEAGRVLRFALRGGPTQSLADLRTAARDLTRRLETLPGVEEISWWGAPETGLVITLDAERARALGLRASDVGAAVRHGLLFDHLDGLEALSTLDLGRGRTLRDVAQLSQGPLEPGPGAWVDGKPEVVGELRLASGAPESSVAEVRHLLEAEAGLRPLGAARELELSLALPDASPEACAVALLRFARALGQLPGVLHVLVLDRSDDAQHPGDAIAVIQLAEDAAPEAVARTARGVLAQGPLALRGIAARGTAALEAQRFQLDVCGADLEALRAASTSAAERLRLAGPVDGPVPEAPLRPQLEVKPDRAKLAELGLSPSALFDALKLAGRGQRLGGMPGHPDDEVVLRLSGPSDPTALLLEGPVPTPITAVATLQQTQQPPAVRRVDGERCVGLEGSAPPEWIDAQRRALAEHLQLPAGVHLAWR
jgi:multidrug efflux pump subunit AcrB